MDAEFARLKKQADRIGVAVQELVRRRVLKGEI